MEQVIIDGIDISLTKHITSLVVTQPYSIERTGTGINWNGSVVLMTGDAPLRDQSAQRTLRQSASATFEELNVISQELFTEDYIELTIIEASQVDVKAIAGILINALVGGDFGIVIDDEPALLAIIQSALS